MAKVDLRSPIYHDEDKARAHLESLLWPQGPVCPRCGVMDDRVTKLAGKSTRPGVYKCPERHIPAYPRKAIEIGNSQGSPFRVFALSRSRD